MSGRNNWLMRIAEGENERITIPNPMTFTGGIGLGTLVSSATTTTGYRFYSASANPTTAPIVQFGYSSYPIQVKIQGRPNDLSTLEVRGRTTKASALTGMGIDSEIEIRPDTTATGGYARGTMGVARLETGKTLAGTFGATGLYGQWRSAGTVNGDVTANAIYGLIEDGGTYTAVNHLAVLWLDSHLAQTVSSGSTSFANITNNGSTTFNNVFHIYAGHKITNLFNISTANGMVSAETGATFAADGVKIRIVVDGSTYYLRACSAFT